MSKLLTLVVVGILIQVTGMIVLSFDRVSSVSTIIMMISFSLIPHAKFNLGFSFARGWMTEKVLGGKIMIGGLSPFVWGIILLVIFLAAVLCYLGLRHSTGMAESDLLTALLGGGLLFASVWSILVWFMYWKDSNRFLTEYQVRVMLTERKWSKDEIDEQVRLLRMRGLIAIADE